MTKLRVEKARKHYEKQVNAGRRKVGYGVGQKVLLNIKNFTMPYGLTPKFIFKVGAPFLIVEQVFKDIYKLQLPANIKVRPTFHVSLLKPFEKDNLWPDCKQVIRPPPDLVGGRLKFEAIGHLQG